MIQNQKRNQGKNASPLWADLYQVPEKIFVFI